MVMASSAKKVAPTIKRFVKVLGEIVALSPSLLVLQLVSLIISNILIFLDLIMPRYVLQALQNQQTTRFFTVIIVFLSLELLVSLIQKMLVPHISSKQEKVNVILIDRFLKKSISFGLKYFDQPGAYDKYVLVFGQCCNIYQNTLSNFLTVISSVVQIVLVISLLSWMTPVALLVLLVISVTQTLITRKIKRYNYSFQKNMAEHSKKLNYLYRLFYLTEFMQDIRVNSLKDFIFKKKGVENNEVISDVFATQKKIAKKTSLQVILSVLENLYITGYLGIMVLTGRIWFDTFLVSQNSYFRLKTAISQLLSTYNQIYENDLYIDDYTSFMTDRMVTSYGIKEISAETIQEIEFRNVSFHYPNTSHQALSHVSFTIHRGERVMIVGENGAGKTTIIKLLLRLYDPDEGNIFINGVPISEYDLTSLRRSFAVLFQTYSLYAFTIRENLTLGESIPDDQIISALKVVKMWDRVSRLPLQLDTPITSQFMENGVEFSGGERQRLAIARIFLKEHGMLVLDEPTSNLDSNIENELFEWMLSRKDCTTLLISHRLTFAYRMSNIICLERGKIVASGSHQQLMDMADDTYRKLYQVNIHKYQSKGETT